MVFAHAGKLDIRHDNHFIVLFVKASLEDIFGAGFARKARHKFGIHLGDTLGRIDKTFAVRVFAHAFQNHPEAIFHFLKIHHGAKDSKISGSRQSKFTRKLLRFQLVEIGYDSGVRFLYRHSREPLKRTHVRFP